MLILSWLRGIISHRPGRFTGTMAGVALTVALLASLGIFIASSEETMTRRAIKEVPVDWQIQLVPGTNINAVKSALAKATSYTKLEVVGYADTAGFQANTAGTTQVTGPGKVLGISDSYRETYPAEIRQLLGASRGVLIAQQTAANLHTTIGDTVIINRIGLPPATVKVDGIVDLPNADSLFQAVGVPANAAPQSPPDNVLLIPSELWHQLFDRQAVIRPDSVRTQLHVKVAHNFSSDPITAFKDVQQRANNLEARIAGSGVVGNNLAARLGGVREDALYAKVLFLFLGLPGAILAILLTFSVAASSEKKRLQEEVLLKIRGASLQQILSLEAAESLIAATGGVVLGILLTFLIHKVIWPGAVFNGKNIMLWVWGSSLAGIILAVVSIVYPAWVHMRRDTAVVARTTVGRGGKALAQRLNLDFIFLIIAAIVFWQTASTGYQLVLTPEGVADTSVHYEAFIAPLCLWIGGVLLFCRLWEAFLNHGRSALARFLMPVSGRLSGVVAASLSRQRLIMGHGMLLVALAISFAVSTSVFNTTYNAQALVDAQLTNGSDVTVSGPEFSAPNSKIRDIKAIPGVAAVQSMQHRLAYVGNDLQDLYGIDPLRIGEATNISNAYFANRNAKESLTALQNQPDGVLVSEETVRDFQLSPGDRLNLRLQNAKDHQYHVVPFTFVGIVREFPTAPNDSFLVANAEYVARHTGSNARETVLIKTEGDSVSVAAQARRMFGTMAGVKVTDLKSVQKVISSSLTSIDLRGLTTIELIFAILLVTASTGLIFAMGLANRRRTFAILAALGAKGNQLGAFLWSEGLLILLGGGLTGVVLGLGIAQTLVKVLTGVFDPPPEFLVIPWGYLTVLGLAAIISTTVVVIGAKSLSQQQIIEEIRRF